MKFKLVVTPRAKRDRDRAYDWYSEHYSKDFADRWYRGISQAVSSLTHNPERCPKPREHERFAFELRELLFGKRRNKHRILFRIHDDKVVILHIRHSAQRDLTEDDL